MRWIKLLSHSLFTLGISCLLWRIYSVFQKSDAKIEIIITAANLIRIKYPPSSIITFLVQTLQISTKSTAQFLSNSCLKNGAQKQKFPVWKSRLNTSSYAIPPVTVCAQSGHHLHRHLHVYCADRTFSAADGFPVCRPCSCVNLPQKSVQC